MEDKLIALSEYFKVGLEEFEKRDLLNSTVNSDVRLFIDPILLKTSKYDLFKYQAREKYEKFFIELKNRVLAILKLPVDKKERAIKNTINWICAKETVGVCLGYSKDSNRGSGVGPDAAGKILNAAITIFELEFENPAIFSVLHLLEDKIGPDYISDLTSKIIQEELCIFTNQMANELGIPTEKEIICNGNKYNLPKHPFLDVPIFLLPKDILSELPIDNNFSKVMGSYARTPDEIKTAINEDIANIYAECAMNTVSEVKQHLRDYIYAKPEALTELLNHFLTLTPEAYDFSKDKMGINLAAIFETILDISQYKIEIEKHKLTIIDDLIKDFKNLLDNNNDIKRSICWAGEEKPKQEKAWQSAFHLFVTRILKSNNIDLTPEYQTGSGPVDFKFSYTASFRVLIELKLSSNTNYIDGLVKQTEKYKECTENTKKAYFIFINVEKEEQKWLEKINRLKEKKKELNIDTEIIFIDGRINPSASNL